MSDPTGWVAPETGWITTDGILNTDLIRIENNILLLKNRIWGYDGTVTAKVTSSYFTTDTTSTWKYTIINKMVFISIPDGFESAGYVTSTGLEIEPDSGAWPSNILPASDTIVQCIFTTNGISGTVLRRPGYMLIPSSTTSNIVCYITDNGGITAANDGYYVDNFFHDSFGSTQLKGIPHQTISYMVDSDPTVTTTTTTTSAP